MSEMHKVQGRGGKLYFFRQGPLHKNKKIYMQYM